MVIIIQDESGREIRRMEVQPGQQIRVPGGDGGPGGGRGPGNQPPGGLGRPGGPGGADLPLPPANAFQPGRAANRAGEAGSDQERRLQNLERRLDEVMRLLEQMRRERNPGAEPRPGRPGAGGRNAPVEEEDPNIKPLDRPPAEPANRRRGRPERSDRDANVPPAGESPAPVPGAPPLPRSPADAPSPETPPRPPAVGPAAPSPETAPRPPANQLPRNPEAPPASR